MDTQRSYQTSQSFVRGTEIIGRSAKMTMNSRGLGVKTGHFLLSFDSKGKQRGSGAPKEPQEIDERNSLVG